MKDLKIDRGTIINCKTEEEKHIVSKLLHELGRKWASGMSYEEKEISHDYIDPFLGIQGGIDYFLTFMKREEIIKTSDFIKLHTEETDTSVSEKYNGYKTILHEALIILNGDRNADYGDPVVNFETIASVLNLALRREDITPDLCAMVHIATKLCREGYRHKRDNLVDLASYADILNQIHDKK